MDLVQEINKFFRGDVAADEATLLKYSRDASLFKIIPKLVVFPKHSEDVQKLVSFVASRKKEMPELSLTARSAGTDMSGGPLNDSIIVDFTKYMSRIGQVEMLPFDKTQGGGYVAAEPGVYYRDFEKETMKKNLFFPSYPASKNLCAIGGIVANNAGGEKSLIYGKTENHVRQVKMVLRNGKEYRFEKLNKEELEQKMAQQDFEGELYRNLYNLFEKNFDEIKNAKPNVSKNSAGYTIWDVWDREYFDMPRLFVGSQGTLGLMTEATLNLVPVKKHSGALIIFLKDLKELGRVINAVLRAGPSTFESFDDHTLKVALKFFTGFLKLLGGKNIVSLFFQFLPEFWMVISGGIPKLALIAQFEGDDPKEIRSRIERLQKELAAFLVKTRIAKDEKEAQKYIAIRRESFNLLRNKIKGKRTAPFIDDFIVLPEKLPEFLPKLNSILDKYPKLIYTIAGHVGDGNFHIIPLMDLKDAEQRESISRLSSEVYDLVIAFGGSITAEHNDGLIRSPFLKKMYGDRIYGIFEEVKRIFDPEGIFNPHKKIGVDLSYAMQFLDHER